MGTAAPIIISEMNDWVALGGGNSGIVGDAAHSFGFHVAADELPASDYSRTQDPNGSDGPYVNWDYACAGDFDHKNNAALRAKHAQVLARLMNGEMPMICEFIGQPVAGQPVVYWARWNGIKTLQRYTGQGHDHWSHISWYRSQVDQRANLWAAGPPVPPSGGGEPAWLHYPWPSYMPTSHYFGLITGPNESRGGYYANERPAIKLIQQRLIKMGFVPGVTDINSGWADGLFEQPTKDAVAAWQRRDWAATTSRYGEVWYDDWYHMMTFGAE